MPSSGLEPETSTLPREENYFNNQIMNNPKSELIKTLELSINYAQKK